jgi:hypothetical protein
MLMKEVFHFCKMLREGSWIWGPDSYVGPHVFTRVIQFCTDYSEVLTVMAYVRSLGIK